MLKVSAMSIFGVYGDPAAAVAAAAAAEVAAAQQHSSSRNAYNRLYDNSGNFLLHALQQQQRQLECERNSLGGVPLAKHYMQLQGKTVPAAIVKQPLDVFLPYEQLDEGHKFLVCCCCALLQQFFAAFIFSCAVVSRCLSAADFDAATAVLVLALLGSVTAAVCLLAVAAAVLVPLPTWHEVFSCSSTALVP